MTTRFHLFLCAATVFASAATAAPAWKYYANNHFGAGADVPAAWQEQPPGTNFDDGRTFVSPDGKASLSIGGGFSGEDSAAKALAEVAEPFEGERVTYTKVGARTATVSGFKGDQIFYRHTLLSCGAEVLNTVSFDYPADQKAAFDPIIAHVIASLRSGVSGAGCKELHPSM